MRHSAYVLGLAWCSLMFGLGCQSSNDGVRDLEDTLASAEARADEAEDRATEADRVAELAEERAEQAENDFERARGREIDYRLGEIMATVEDSAAVRGLLARWRDLNSGCRGGAEGPATTRACEAREMVGARLEAMGVCYGREGEYGFESAWHVCREDSERRHSSAWGARVR